VTSAITTNAASATRRGTSNAVSATIGDPLASTGRPVSESHARTPKPAAQNAVNARKPRVAPVVTRASTTTANEPTASAVRTVQLINARFEAIRSAGTAPSVAARSLEPRDRADFRGPDASPDRDQNGPDSTERGRRTPMAIGRDTTFTWLGHAGVEIVTPGDRTILIDPWFENPNSPRTQEEQPACDVLLLTHGHFDHLSAATLDLARRLRPVMPCVHELSLFLERQATGAEVVGMNAGGTYATNGLKITMVPAVHSSGDTMGAEEVRYFGEPGGFVIELENGFRVYHSGDTTVFGDMTLIRDLYAPDLAMLSIGGHYTMAPREAAVAVELLGVRDVLPVHWGTFPILTGTPAELDAAVRERGLHVRVHDWAPGGSVS
jgi:L-ascorbate metabolism protein UlaG (beta-lactamase superfamily)